MLIIDVQDRLAPATHDSESTVANCVRLVRAARRLDIPLLATEHYPKGLGPTVKPLAALISKHEMVEKIHFSCAADPGFRRRFEAFGRDQVAVAGLEAHVCIMQTAIALRRAGQMVAVIADAVTSRSPSDRDLALDRLRAEGVLLASAEMILFEWLERGDTAAFKDVFTLIR